MMRCVTATGAGRSQSARLCCIYRNKGMSNHLVEIYIFLSYLKSIYTGGKTGPLYRQFPTDISSVFYSADTFQLRCEPKMYIGCEMQPVEITRCLCNP